MHLRQAAGRIHDFLAMHAIAHRRRSGTTLRRGVIRRVAGAAIATALLTQPLAAEETQWTHLGDRGDRALMAGVSETLVVLA